MHDYIDWENHPDKFEELQLMILNKQCEVEKANEQMGNISGFVCSKQTIQ